MSTNTTPVTEPKLAPETVVTPIPVPEKVDGKFKTAIKHPITTAKRHKVAVAVAAGTALGAVAASLLTSKANEEKVTDAYIEGVLDGAEAESTDTD